VVGGREILVTHLWRAIRGVCCDRCGASAAEYALLLGILGGSLAVAAFTLGGSVSCSLDTSADLVSGQDGSNGHQYGHSDPNGLAKGQRANC